MATVLLENQRAAVLAIGTANPSNCVLQEDYTNWCFGVTRSDHLSALKAKMKKLCEKSGVRKRHIYLTSEIIVSYPEILDRALPSLGARLSITEDALPKLAAAAAVKAIAEWGRPATDITHLVFSTNSGAAAPGPDLRLAALLGLSPGVQRTVLFLHGCSAGSGALRVAKDLAENSRGARVLVVSADICSVVAFRAPDEAHLDAIVVNTLIGDGAGAAIIGAIPRITVERPIFYMVSASQATLPGTEGAVWLRLRESGLHYNISAEIPALVRGSIERCLVDALAPLGLTGDRGGSWNSLFWAAHPGGRAILDSYQATLGLDVEKLAVSRHVLSEYGNMLGATILFVLDELRRRRQSGDVDCKWGVMLGLGPGLTVETMVLQAADNQDQAD